MSCPPRLWQWHQQVSSAFPQLSKPQTQGLAWWSAGIALTGSVGISQISALLALVLDQKEGTVSQRLREWYLEAQAKWGGPRQDLVVSTCFGPLLGWLIRLLGDAEHRLALALDATTLGDRWIVLSVSVLVRGCAIPVAWKVLPAHAKGSWRPYWEGLLERLQGRVPADWLVVVLADRGLYARWLYAAIVRCGWHPFLRINLAVKVRPVGTEQFDWLSCWAPQAGTSWKGEVDCFVQKKSRLRCTLLLRWEAGYEHAWAVMTDLAAEQANIAWYALRAWIEAGFKDLKRGGWGWHHSKMREASRVERLWLAMAVALVWTVAVGSQADSQRPVPCLEHVPPTHVARKRRKRSQEQPAARRLSCPVRGRLGLLAALLNGQEVPRLRLVAEPWPERVAPLQRAVSATRVQQQAKKQARKRRYKVARRRKRAA
jgi:DDE family transposase